MLASLLIGLVRMAIRAELASPFFLLPCRRARLVLDLRSGADRVAREREGCRHEADPTFLTHGPRTRREFLNFKTRGG
jgi:hypothetical protein